MFLCLSATQKIGLQHELKSPRESLVGLSGWLKSGEKMTKQSVLRMSLATAGILLSQSPGLVKICFVYGAETLPKSPTFYIVIKPRPYGINKFYQFLYCGRKAKGPVLYSEAPTIRKQLKRDCPAFTAVSVQVVFVANSMVNCEKANITKLYKIYSKGCLL